MIVTLENEYLQIELKSFGAELTKVYSKKTKLQYIWHGDPTHWNRHTPILFPIVGRLKSDRYILHNREYELSKHGFARDQIFSIISQTENEVIFELSYTDETLVSFPFKFKLQVIYQLDNTKLSVTYKVGNQGDETMFYTIGAHPALKCPLLENTDFSDYYIEFEKEETPKQLLLDPITGFRNNQIKSIALGKKLPLSYDLFINDAIIFEGLASKKVSLKSEKHNHGVHLEIPDWNFLAFWTKKEGTPFICFEPWMGITDANNSSLNYTDKLGIMKVSNGQFRYHHHTFDFF